MKKQVIAEAQRRMLRHLNNEQLKILDNVLHDILDSKEVIEIDQEEVVGEI